mmetsp:Transcript_27287/g.78066  ORF Transcript_27287/g.78066 Transcript_27287/m.78066 type:complete len:337 (-) Transcript_27287:276-1286(-)
MAIGIRSLARDVLPRRSGQTIAIPHDLQETASDQTSKTVLPLRPMSNHVGAPFHRGATQLLLADWAKVSGTWKRILSQRSADPSRKTMNASARALRADAWYQQSSSAGGSQGGSGSRTSGAPALRATVLADTARAAPTPLAVAASAAASAAARSVPGRGALAAAFSLGERSVVLLPLPPLLPLPLDLLQHLPHSIAYDDVLFTECREGRGHHLREGAAALGDVGDLALNARADGGLHQLDVHLAEAVAQGRAQQRGPYEASGLEDLDIAASDDVVDVLGHGGVCADAVPLHEVEQVGLGQQLWRRALQLPLRQGPGEGVPSAGTRRLGEREACTNK